ncbi:Hypothetical predicted protein [Paramuricea clavata]|uniref:Uncharacterized protein n=1 Tax=Paramuricea clavata TaxID=317549 RepID=A0A6S7JQ34_PARCT|nr:Hypothetical predicted protein [Paramuricea clavata]
MKEFLQRLQRSGVPEGKDEVDNEVIVHKTDGPLDIVQGQIKNDKGISLAIYRLPNNIEEQCLHGCIEKVLGLVPRLNFGLKQFYNIVILGSVADITKAEQRIRENYRGENEIGFYAWNTTTGSNNKSGNLGMINCAESFLIHHAAVGNNVLPEHFNFGEELVSNFIGNDNNNDILERLIGLFSQECDWILDINSSKASATLMALKTKRNAIYLCETNDEEFYVKREISDTKRNRLDG